MDNKSNTFSYNNRNVKFLMMLNNSDIFSYKNKNVSVPVYKVQVSKIKTSTYKRICRNTEAPRRHRERS